MNTPAKRIFYRVCLMCIPAFGGGAYIAYEKTNWKQQDEMHRLKRILRRRRKAIESLRVKYERQSRPKRWRFRWAKWAQRNHPDPEFIIEWDGEWWEEKNERTIYEIFRIHKTATRNQKRARAKRSRTRGTLRRNQKAY